MFSLYFFISDGGIASLSSSFTYLALRTSLQALSPRALLSPLWALWHLGFCYLLSGSIASWALLPPLGALGSNASWAPSPLRLRRIACRALWRSCVAIASWALSPLRLCYCLPGSIAPWTLLSPLRLHRLSYRLSGSAIKRCFRLWGSITSRA